MSNPIGVPIACGFFGSIMGLVAGCGQCFPVIVGGSTGASVGCVICIYSSFFGPSDTGTPVAKIVHAQPTVVQNIYILEPMESTGAPKIVPANTGSDEQSK